jgi:hypothetical protein
VKNKLVLAAVAVLALSPPALYAGNGYGQAVVQGLISGGIQAALNHAQPVVVEKRTVVVVHDHKSSTKPVKRSTTSKPAKNEVVYY